MRSYKTIELVVETTPEALGKFVTSKAYHAANRRYGLPMLDCSEENIITWGVFSELNIPIEWYNDAFQFFNNPTIAKALSL